MSEDDIDLDRVLIDPEYRRRVIEYLNAVAREQSTAHPPAAEPRAAVLHRN